MANLIMFFASLLMGFEVAAFVCVAELLWV
jgi:hypothetical protein